MDLKQIFQTVKDTREKEDETPWNVDSDGEKAEVVWGPTALMIWGEQTGGFTFSIFESDAKDEKGETYRAEAVKPGKMSWQGDPSFQDSSSEEEVK